jgi:hypothetical protein
MKEPETEESQMEKTQILCFPPSVTVKLIKERQNLSKEKIKELNDILHYFSNTNNGINWIDVEKFNKISGLYVNFKCGNNFYCIKFNFNPYEKKVYFEASFRMFNNKDYDSSDEEDNKLTSYFFRPFNRLYPEKVDGVNKLTLDMYFDFVHKCITMDEFYHEYIN